MSGKMLTFVNLDSTTWVCPCGASLSSTYYDEIKVFMAKHNPHTEGETVETITEDGARCLASKPEPRTY